MADLEREVTSEQMQDKYAGISRDTLYPGTPSSHQSIVTSQNSPDKEKDEVEIPDDASDHVRLEIVEHYLTFSTILPEPTHHASRPNPTIAPEPPDLQKFTSPFDWPESRKRLIIWMSCIITLMTAYSAGSYSPGVGQMTEEWHISSVAALVGITMYTVGFGIAPMVLAPFSEINGRRPVFIASGIVFVICQLCSGLTQSFAGMLVVRFLVGCGGSTFSTMVGGVVSDVYHTEDRNTPMALFAGAALFGTGAGPLVSGFIAQNLSWRWIFHVQTIANAVMVAVITVVFKETRGSVLLSRKAAALNKWYAAREVAGHYGFDMPGPTLPDAIGSPTTVSQRIRWKVLEDEQRASLAKLISVSLYRPFRLLITEPVVFWFSIWVAFSWAVLYLTLAAVPLVFTRTHGFTLEQANAVFAATCIASVLASAVSIHGEKLFRRRYATLARTPEGRLYFACVESACMPIGLFLFGWTSASASIHWIVPTVALGIATVGIFAIYLATFNYLADTYHRYASSALAAQSFCRNMLGGVFPLVTATMYNRLSFGGASSLLGGIGTLLTVVPWILVFYGPRIRARSKFASGLAEKG